MLKTLDNQTHVWYTQGMASQGNTSIKARKYTFALSNPDQWESAIEYAEGCPAYAYIKHDKDSDASPHYHFYIEFPNPRSLNAVAEDLNLPPNMIEKVRAPQGLLKYLTHTDDKSVAAGKHPYTFEEIHTNLPESSFAGPIDKRKLWLEITDMVDAYYKGELSYRDLRQRLLSFVDTMSPLQMFQFALKIRSYAVPSSDDFTHVPVVELHDGKTRNGGLSNRSEFHVPSAVQQVMFPRDPAA